MAARPLALLGRHRRVRGATAATLLLPAAALLSAAPAWLQIGAADPKTATRPRPFCCRRGPATLCGGWAAGPNTAGEAPQVARARRGPKDVDWRTPKRTGLAPTELAREVALALQDRSWFVSGDIAVEFFAEDFLYCDRPQGKDQAGGYVSMEDGGKFRIEGPRPYAKARHALYDQDETRMDILDVRMNGPEEFVIEWRIEGKLSTGFSIKPHVTMSSFKIGSNGLIDYQRDDCDVPEWDLQASAITPWMPGLKPPAPPVDQPFVVPETLQPFKR